METLIILLIIIIVLMSFEVSSCKYQIKKLKAGLEQLRDLVNTEAKFALSVDSKVDELTNILQTFIKEMKEKDTNLEPK